MITNHTVSASVNKCFCSVNVWPGDFFIEIIVNGVVTRFPTSPGSSPENKEDVFNTITALKEVVEKL